MEPFTLSIGNSIAPKTCNITLFCCWMPPLETSGAKVLFGGKPLSSETARKIPGVYGAWEPTAVFVPLKEILRSPENFALCTTEIFGPFQASHVFRVPCADVRRLNGFNLLIPWLVSVSVDLRRWWRRIMLLTKQGS